MSPPPQNSAESRRKHTKSRNGCLVCKRRRVKCDEVRPRCGKCVFGKRPCSYGDETPNSSVGHTTPEGRVTPELANIFAVQAVDLGLSVSDTSGGHFTAIHMALLFHATTSTRIYVGLGHHEHVHVIIRIALEAAHTAPFLLDQLLALSALHFSATSLDTGAVFQQQAAALQNRALTNFKECQEHLDTNYKSSFLFAGLLGVHVLRNSLANRNQSLGIFISGFVKSLRILRGVRAVIQRHWHDILESELKPLLSVTERIEDRSACQGSETSALRRHLQLTSGLPASSANACLEALHWVQHLLDLAREDPSNACNIQGAISWPVLISEEYIETLYQHRPEALAVLAYFAAILHQHRTFWVFEDSGSFSFGIIAAHLGPFWSDALAWPRDFICGR